MDLKSLQFTAEQSAYYRGHKIEWEAPYHGEYNSIQTGVCKCGMYVQVCTRPYPNGVAIGGDALALDCTLTHEE
jgi:hypothetical protein